MANATIAPPKPTSTTTITRRSSVVPAVLTIPPSQLPNRHFSSFSTTASAAASSSSSSTSSSHSFRSVDLDLSYISLKDILPSVAVNSPTPSVATTQSSYDIGIRNRLVKQAAWAYLQPMSTYSDSDHSGSFFHRAWIKFSGALAKNSVVRALTRALDWFLRVIRIRDSK